MDLLESEKRGRAAKKRMWVAGVEAPSAIVDRVLVLSSVIAEIAALVSSMGGSTVEWTSMSDVNIVAHDASFAREMSALVSCMLGRSSRVGDPDAIVNVLWLDPGLARWIPTMRLASRVVLVTACSEPRSAASRAVLEWLDVGEVAPTSDRHATLNALADLGYSRVQWRYAGLAELARVRLPLSVARFVRLWARRWRRVSGCGIAFAIIGLERRV